MLAGEDAGSSIAVKVIDRRLKTTVELDLSLMRGVARLLELLPRLRWLSLYETVDEFGQLMESQVPAHSEYGMICQLFGVATAVLRAVDQTPRVLSSLIANVSIRY